MAIYTTQLRSIVEQIQHDSHADPDDFSVCYHYLGLDSYPIFDENYRSTLNDKIIRHFYFREIGFETAAQFAWFLRNHMNEQMPYFNQLYDSEKVVFNPITNRKYTWDEMYSLAQGGGTTTDTTSANSTSGTVNEHVDDDLTHGHRIAGETTYGKTETDVTDFGKTHDMTETLDSDKSNTVEETTGFGKTHDMTETLDSDRHNTVNETTRFGRTNDSSTTTTYGSQQDTVNGGSDQMTEGGVHERVVHSDTPMNQITNQGVEDLNYASDVTYTDRDGTTASVNQYGGTTEVTNSGSDTTLGTSADGGSESRSITGTDSRDDTKVTAYSEGGSETRNLTDTEARNDTKETTSSEGGSETSTKSLSGMDATVESHTGTDQRDITKSRTDSGTSSGTGSSEFQRDLDESGERTHNVIGYDGIAPADLLMRWRESFLNIDLQVIASLEVLFFGLWN